MVIDDTYDVWGAPRDSLGGRYRHRRFQFMELGSMNSVLGVDICKAVLGVKAQTSALLPLT